MRIRSFSPVMLFIALLLLWPQAIIGAQGSSPYRSEAAYVSVGQSNDNREWHIVGQRSVGGFVDSVQVSPDISPANGLLGFSEPTIVGEDSILYCAMLVHKQVKGDSAYIMVRKSVDFGLSWETLGTVGESQAIARHLRADYCQGKIYLVWEDCRSGYWRIYHAQMADY